MSFSNDGQSYSSWQDYATSRLWDLSGGNGTKTVYVRYRDNAGNISSPATATTYLHTTKPSSGVIPLSPYQNSNSFPVSWSGSALGNGLAGFDVQYKDATPGAWTDWVTGTLSTTAVFTGTEGHTYYFQSRARDLAGNVEDYVGGDGHTHTLVDLTPPNGAVVVNGGALDTTQVTVTLSLSATDALSGVSNASYSNDGSAWSSWEAYATNKLWALSSGDGAKTTWVRFQDNAGNIATPVSGTINLDTSAASAYGFSINEGALFTNQVTVTLDLPANPNTSQMMLSNDGGFYGATWEPYSAYKTWQITQYGSFVLPRTVYVKYKDVNGSIFGAFSDEIILDVNAPSGSVSIDGSGAVTGTDRVATTALTLRLAANDDVSGVGGMMIGSSPDFSGASWESFSATKSWTVGSSGKVYVAFKDNAGNASPIYGASLSGAKQTLPSVVLGTVHPKTGGTLASSETGMQVSFPPGAVGAKADVTLVPEVDSSQSSNTGALKSAGKFLTLTALQGTKPVTSFSKSYTMTVSYLAADITGIDEDSLAIYTWNGTGWVKEATSQVDKPSKTVSAAIDHLSSFALLGQGKSGGNSIYLPLLTKQASGW